MEATGTIKAGDIVTYSRRWANDGGYTIVAPVVIEDGKLVSGKGLRISHYDGEPDRVSRHIGGADITEAWKQLYFDSADETLVTAATRLMKALRGESAQAA